MKKRKASGFDGRLPSGAFTTSQRRYLREWADITQPLQERLGVAIIGFDPGILVCDASGRSQSVDIPLWLARRILNLPGAIR